MRRWIGLAAIVALAPTGAGAGAKPYEGVWGTSRAACRDPDGADKMLIGADRIDWYETHCRVRRVVAEGPGLWRLGLACSGEGRRFAANSRIALSRGTLTMDESPVGPTPHQVYVRCKDK